MQTPGLLGISPWSPKLPREGQGRIEQEGKGKLPKAPQPGSSAMRINLRNKRAMKTTRFFSSHDTGWLIGIPVSLGNGL
jgi:hypothetical protein